LQQSALHVTISKRIGSILASDSGIAKLLCITCKFVAALAAANLTGTPVASYSSDFAKFEREQIAFLDRGTAKDYTKSRTQSKKYS